MLEAQLELISDVIIVIAWVNSGVGPPPPTQLETSFDPPCIFFLTCKSQGLIMWSLIN